MSISQPQPVPMTDTHNVPWSYEKKVEFQIGETSNFQKFPPSSQPDIAEIGGFTRSGRCYGPAEIGANKKMKEAEIVKDDEILKDNLEEEFLSIVKKSDFDIVEQLRKTPARISFLSLILASEAHRKALLRILDQTYIQPDVTPENFVGLVDPTKAGRQISFSNEEISSQAEGNFPALHITLFYKEFTIAKVLIDGGSALNVLPKSTLYALNMTEQDLKPKDMIVRAFDGNKTKILGEITLSLRIGPKNFPVLFQVMDIDAAYTMLLGRPWIHSAGAVPSSLHQRVKYIDNGKVIVVRGEEEIMLSKPVSMPYVENTRIEESSELRNFEEFKEENPSPNVNQIVSKIMKNYGYQAGKGLGVSLQGTTELIPLIEKKDKHGLGYKEGLERAMDALSIDKKSGRIPLITETFLSSGKTVIPLEDSDQTYKIVIATLEEDVGQSSFIHLTTEEMSKNWHIEPVLAVVDLK